MLKMGFIEDVDFILSCIMQEHQTLLFSATMPPEDRAADPDNTSNRPSASISTATSGHPNHSPITSSTSPAAAVTRSSITSRTKRSSRASYSATHATKHPTCSAPYKGASVRLTSSTAGLDQERRTSIFRRFRQQKIRFMVATDVAGRGLDFSHVTHVINYDFPFNAEIYNPPHGPGRAHGPGRQGSDLGRRPRPPRPQTPCSTPTASTHVGKARHPTWTISAPNATVEDAAAAGDDPEVAGPPPKTR